MKCQAERERSGGSSTTRKVPAFTEHNGPSGRGIRDEDACVQVKPWKGGLTSITKRPTRRSLISYTSRNGSI